MRAVELALQPNSRSPREPDERPSPGQRCAIWVYGDDFDAAVALLRAAGVHVTAEPEDQPWADEARVQDPDGNEIIIGTHA